MATTSSGSAVQAAARVFQQPHVDSLEHAEEQVQSRPLGYSSSTRQDTARNTFYSSSGVSRAISNPKSYAGRVQTKPGLAIATSAPGGEDSLLLSPTSTTDTDYYAGTSPAAVTSSRPRRRSVADQSPLQQLEGHFESLSKEEKRARAEAAEEQARRRGAEKIIRKPTENTVSAPQKRDRQDEEFVVAPRRTDLKIEPAKPDHPTRSNTTAASASAGQPASPTSPFSRSQSQRYGHDAALTGGAAAAALGAFQAARQQKPLPALPGRASSGRAPTRDISQSSIQPNEPRTIPTDAQASQVPATQYSNASYKGPQSQFHANQREQQQGEYSSRATTQAQSHDPLPPSEVKNQEKAGPTYQISPQTAAGVNARQQVGFTNEDPNEVAPVAHEDGHLHRFFHRTKEPMVHSHGPAPLDEWKTAQTAELTHDDVESDAESDDQAWWERRGAKGNTSQKQTGPAFGAPYDGGNEAGENQTTFTPKLFLKCGPLLRYTGIKKISGESENSGSVVWTGSVMIVTEDTKSSLQNPPTLQLFKQSRDPVVVPSKQIRLDDGRVVPEYFDALAGQTKVGRNGITLFVKPIDQVKGEVDLSNTESDEGLFVRSIQLPKDQSGPKSKSKAGRIREVRGFRLLTERGVTFWRFNLKVHLRSKETRIAYRINGGPVVGFWVPAIEQSMNLMFHSCNGFSLSVNPNEFSGPDPLWRDVMNRHQHRPFHAMIGGGDQIYNDAAMRNTTLFQEWLEIKNPEHKHSAKFTPEMQAELEIFYLNRYAMWFSQGIFGMANSQIPMINIWDDHDIMDGFGSYPHHFMSTPVFSGVGAVAFKYYMLFQHQSVPAETEETESSWLLGASPGPYINELSRSLFMSLGKGVAFLGLDCRTERMRDEILSEQTYDRVFDRCESEITKGQTKHLIVLLGVPIAYPRLNFLENILTSRLMDPLKALGRTGLLGGFVNKFDGGVEILDDLDDHWTAKHHKHERNWLIQELQLLAASKSVRVTILGGDVHLAAVGQFYSNKKLGIPKDRDHRYMPNVVSSAIVNTPPPEMMGDIINKRNKIHHLDKETDEDMIPLFPHDVNGKNRNNLHLLPRRNWCSITPFQPSNPSAALLTVPGQASSDQARPSSRGSFSLMRRNSTDGTKTSLLRRFSTRKAPPSSFKPPVPDQLGDRTSLDAQRVSMDTQSVQSARDESTPARSNSFLRRPTSSHMKGTSGQFTEINLEGGLEICINCEIDQKDPAGITQPYNLLVPALFYNGPADPNTASAKSRMDTIFGSLRRRNTQKRNIDTAEQSHEDTVIPFQPPAARSGVANGNHSVEQTHLDDGDYSDNDEFHDAPDGATMPAVVSNTPPVPQSRAVSNAMSQNAATNGIVIPDSSYRQPKGQSTQGRSPSAEWGGLGGTARSSRQASTKSRVISDSPAQPQASSSSYPTPLQTGNSSAFMNDSNRTSLAKPGPLTANPPTPSNANFEPAAIQQVQRSSQAPTEQMRQSMQQALPRTRPSTDGSRFNPPEWNNRQSEANVPRGVLGPAPPANIDQLPDAIRKRYSQYSHAAESSSVPTRSQSHGANAGRPGQGRPLLSADPTQTQRSQSSQNIPTQSNGSYPPQPTFPGNNIRQSDSASSQPWASQPKPAQNGPVYQSQNYQLQQPQSQSTNLQPNGNTQQPRIAPTAVPAANWQAPNNSYARPQTPPRDSRALFHDEDALNELLGTSKKSESTSKRASSTKQTQQQATHTLPPQQAPFPFPASQLQSEMIQPHYHSQATSQPLTAGPQSYTTQATSKPTQPTTASPLPITAPSLPTNAAPQTANFSNRAAQAPAHSQAPQSPQNHTTYHETSSTSSLSMPPDKPELFLQSRVPTSQRNTAARGSKLDRMFGGDAPLGLDGAAAPPATRGFGGQDSYQGSQDQKTGFVGKVMRRLSEAGSGRKGSASGEGGGSGGSGWRSWR